MDDDLTRLLDAMQQENAAAHVGTRHHFDAVAQQLGHRFDVVTEQLSHRFDVVTQQLSHRFDVVTEQLSHRFDVVAEQLDDRFDVVVEQLRHRFDVVAEQLEGRIALVAEGVVANSERMDRIDSKIDAFAADMKNEFNGVRSMITFSHAELDRRIRALEKE